MFCRGFDLRVRSLLTDANDKWLGLELAPVTAQQVVTLLNYVTQVKEQVSGSSLISTADYTVQ